LFFPVVPCRYWRAGIQTWVCCPWSSLWYRERTSTQDRLIFTNPTWHCISWLVPHFWWRSVEIIQKSCHPNSICWVTDEECGKFNFVYLHGSVEMLMLFIQNAVMLTNINHFLLQTPGCFHYIHLWLKSESFRCSWLKIGINF
jgi:hypothetical protein